MRRWSSKILELEIIPAEALYGFGSGVDTSDWFGDYDLALNNGLNPAIDGIDIATNEGLDTTRGFAIALRSI